MRLLVATRSSHKMSEIRQILGDVPGLTLLDLDEAGIARDAAEDDLEPYETFEENALSKAEYFSRLTGLATVADDSGLEVDALGGAPGVRSKRFAPDQAVDGQARDDANNRHLVAQLQGVDPGERTARYVCVALLVEGDDAPLLFRGEAAVRVIEEARGSGGFGYDPYMFDVDFGGTFAEMSPEEKNARSHRGKAFRALAATLRQRRE